MADTRPQTVFLCGHCGEKKQSSTLLCKSCMKKSQREEMDAENESIFEAKGKTFFCEFCEREKRQEAERKLNELKYVQVNP